MAKPMLPLFALVHADGTVEQTTTTKAEARDVAFRWKMNQKVTLRIVELVEKPKAAKKLILSKPVWLATIGAAALKGGV